MKVKANIINTWCIIMSEAVTVPRLMMMASIVSEESLARDARTHTHARTHARPPARTHARTLTHRQTLTSSILIFFNVVIDFENRKEVNQLLTFR